MMISELNKCIDGTGSFLDESAVCEVACFNCRGEVQGLWWEAAVELEGGDAANGGDVVVDILKGRIEVRLHGHC